MLKELRALQVNWVPKLLCSNSVAHVTTYVGTRLTAMQLNRGYAQSVQRMLSDMEAIGMNHNDLVKHDTQTLVEAMSALHISKRSLRGEHKFNRMFCPIGCGHQSSW